MSIRLEPARTHGRMFRVSRCGCGLACGIVGRLMAPPPTDVPPAPPWSGSTWLSGLAVAAWLVACDAWVKMTARVAAACTDAPSVREAWSQIWAAPSGCGEADFFGFARLSPVARGGPWGLPGSGAVWAYVLLAVAAIVSVLVLRWRWRTRGDASALGALWGAAIVLALPALLGQATGAAELHLGGLATGLGDLALAWAALWLGARAIAEARA